VYDVRALSSKAHVSTCAVLQDCTRAYMCLALPHGTREQAKGTAQEYRRVISLACGPSVLATSSP